MKCRRGTGRLVWLAALIGLQGVAAEDPGFSVRHMDQTVSPKVDFAKFAAGGWYGRTTIPADKSRWGGFNELAEQNWAAIRVILEGAAAAPGEPGGVKQKVGDFFASAMDVTGIEARGVQSLTPDFTAIDAARDVDELFALAAKLALQIPRGRNVDAVLPFFSMSFGADQKKSDTYTVNLRQGGMSLPSKEYYASPKFARERWEFVGHVARMFELAGLAKGDAYAQAETVLRFERALAEQAKLPADLRDPLANYHRMSVEEAVKSFPGLPLRRWITAVGLPASVSELVIGQPRFFEGLSTLVRERPWRS